MQLRLLLAAAIALALGSAATVTDAADEPADKARSAAEAASAPQRQAGATTNKPGYDKDEVVCRREQVTGSRATRTLCHTREQWERMRLAGVEGVKNVQRAPIPVSGP